MQGKRKSARPAVRQAIGAAVILAVATTGFVAAEEPSLEQEGSPKHPPLVDVGWPQLRQSEQALTTPSLELEVENTSPFPLTAQVHVSADHGTTAPPITLVLQSLELPTQQEKRLRIELNALQAQASLREYAGGLRTMVLACLADAVDRSDCQAISPADWFLHLDYDGSLRVYDAPTLHDRYGSGDLSQAGLPAELVRDGEETAYPDRVVAWVAPDRALATSDDDGPAAIEEVER